jgi:hypothetical protein
MAVKWKIISSAEFDRAVRGWTDLERAYELATVNETHGRVIMTVYRVNDMPALRRITYMCASDRKRVATRRHWMSKWYEMNRAGLMVDVFL